LTEKYNFKSLKSSTYSFPRAQTCLREERAMNEHFGMDVYSIQQTCIKKADKDGSYAVATALFEIAKTLDNLGFGTTHHPGAIEGHTMKMMESLSSLCTSLDSIANSLDSIANAISEKELTS
jgi:hypothetical protein